MPTTHLYSLVLHINTNASILAETNWPSLEHPCKQEQNLFTHALNRHEVLFITINYALKLRTKT